MRQKGNGKFFSHLVLTQAELLLNADKLLLSALWIQAGSAVVGLK